MARAEQHDEHVLDWFLRGRPIPYVSLTGSPLTAKFSPLIYEIGLPALTITDAAGNIISDIICGQDKATAFFLNRNALAEA